MKGRTNMSEVKMQGYFPLMPDGSYHVEITDFRDKITANKDPMISIELTVIEGEHTGRMIWDNIIIPADNSPAIKIKGRTKHFLHCIGEPYENDIDYDSDRWLWRKVWVNVGWDFEQKKDVSGKYVPTEKKRNVVKGYLAPDDIDVNRKDVDAGDSDKKSDLPNFEE